MLEPQLGRGVGDMLGLQRIDRARHAGLDVAEGAGARAGVAEDHHRRVLLGPALADIRAGRLLAHRGEVEAAHQLARLGEAGAGRRLDADPVGLALARRASDRVEISFMRAQIAMPARACHPSPVPWQSGAMTDFNDLIDGYRRFRDQRAGRAQRERWAELAEGQSPRGDGDRLLRQPGRSGADLRRRARARCSSCATSPPSSRRSSRTAGYHGVSAALEFAVTQLEVDEIVVMGHGLCGGCAAALTGQFEDARPGEGGFIAHWVDMLDEARDKVRATHSKPLGRSAFLQMEHESVRISLRNLEYSLG